MKRLIVLLAASVVTFTATAQEFQYEAQIDSSGDIVLKPLNDTEEPTDPSWETQPTDDFSSFDKVYVRTDASGSIIEVFQTEAEALAEPLDVGDTIVAAAMSTGAVAGAGMNMEQLRQIAQEASVQMFQAARDSVCDFDLKPESVTPSVQVSFSLFAGASFTVSATWMTDKLCSG